MANRVCNSENGDCPEIAGSATMTDDPTSDPIPGDTVTIGSFTVSSVQSEARSNSVSFELINVTLETLDGPPAILGAADAGMGQYFVAIPSAHLGRGRPLQINKKTVFVGPGRRGRP